MAQRKSNFELLRLVSIFLILVFHCAFKSEFSFVSGFDFNKWLVKCFWMFGELGVNLFTLITGYFMVNSRFRWKKLVLLEAAVQFYNWPFALLRFWLEGDTLATKREIFLNFFPMIQSIYWFITAYAIIYLLSPFLNILLHAMDKKTFQRFLVLLLLLYSVIPTAFGVFYGSSEWLLFYNRLIWMGIAYCIGAYLRQYPDNERFTAKRGGVLAAASFAVMALSILLIDRFSGFFAYLGTTEIAYFWPPNTVPMVLLSIGVFLVFMDLKIGHIPWINRLASTAPGIYLFSDGLLSYEMWHLFHCERYQDSPLLGLYMLLAAGIVMAIGMMVETMRQWLEKHTLRPLLDRLWPDAPKTQTNG